MSARGLELVNMTKGIQKVCANSVNISATVNILKLFKALLKLLGNLTTLRATLKQSSHDCPSHALREIMINSRGRLSSAVTK